MKLPKRYHRYVVDGKWTLPDQQVRIDGVWHDIHSVLNQKTDPQVNSYADMGQTLDPGHIEEPGDGDSQSTE